MKAKNSDTKDALISAAYELFAERGYDGVSIAEIAGELGITKQALLHHYGSKEKLYGKVLEDLSNRFDRIVQASVDQNLSAADQFRSILRGLYRHMNEQKHDARLIMRELLENKPRIEQKHKWYLKPFLEKLTELMQQLSGNENLSKSEALSRTFQIMGAVNYFAISDPTLQKMFGKDTYRAVEQDFLNQLEQLFLKP